MLDGIPRRAAHVRGMGALPNYSGVCGLGDDGVLPAANPIGVTVPTGMSKSTMHSIPLASETTSANPAMDWINFGAGLATSVVSLWQNVENAKHEREMAEKRLAEDSSNTRYQAELNAAILKEKNAEEAFYRAQQAQGNGGMKKWLIIGGLGVAALIAVMMVMKSNQNDKLMMAQLMQR